MITFGANLDAPRCTERNHASLVEIAVVATEHVGFSAFGGLHHIEIIGVAQRSVVGMLDYDRLACLLKELSVIVEFVFRQRIEFLQSRIAEHLDRLDDDFVGEKQSVTTRKQVGQHFSPGRATGWVRADQDSRIKDNPQPTGL
jgi:hypothetical protein